MEFERDAGWERRSAVLEIVRGSLTGTVDGVEFDLTGGVIDPAHWRMSTDLYWTGLVFPWDDEFATTPDTIPSLPPMEPDAPKWHDEWFQTHDERMPVRVYRGDKVSVDKIRRWGRGGRTDWDDPHDKLEYGVRLKITRSDGTVVRIPESMTFVAKDAMGPHSEYVETDDESYAEWIREFHITFDKIAHRVGRLFKAQQPHPGEWLTLANNMVWEVRDRLKDLEFDKMGVGEIADIAATAGYALSKAEAEAKLEPLARSEIKSQEQRARAAKAGAISRTKPDTPDLKRAAADMCRSDPNLSLNKCCQELATRFGREPANVKRLVLHLFEKRHLPNGRTEYRPRREGSSAS